MSHSNAITASDVRLARALVQAAARRGRRESAHIEAIANTTATAAAMGRTVERVTGTTDPEIRLARALVSEAAKRGRRESSSIEAIAQLPTSDDGDGHTAD